jgi:hypothetical protein
MQMDALFAKPITKCKRFNGGAFKLVSLNCPSPFLSNLIYAKIQVFKNF